MNFEPSVAGFLLAFIPACINLAILIYILLYMPKGKIISIFSFLLLAILFLQIEHSLFRLEISKEVARSVDQIFSIGWLAMGPLVLHFAVIFIDKNFVNSRLFYLVLYAPYIIFFSFYHANPTPIPVETHKIWGYILYFREGTTDSIQRYWLAGLILLALFLLIRFSLDRENDIRKRKQAAIISIGIIFPTIQGISTQIFLPFWGYAEIPVTSTFMTFLSAAIIIALKKYKLFDISESINVDKVLQELSSMVFFVANQNIIYFNPASRKILLGEESKKISMPLSQIFIPGDPGYETFNENILTCKGDKEESRNLETTFLTNQKKPIHVLVNSQPVYNNGKFQGILVFAQDITHRIVSEKALKFSNERFNFVLKATNEAIWDLDIKKNLVYWGEGYSNIFGYDVKGNATPLSHWEERVHPEDGQFVLESFRNYLKENKNQKWEIEYRYLKKEGTYAYVLVRGYILRNSDGEAVRVIGAMQDNTKIKSYIRKIENQNMALIDISWLQSHVIRAPLTKIMGLAEVLEDKEIDEEEREILMKHLVQCCHDLDGVIREISEKTKYLV